MTSWPETPQFGALLRAHIGSVPDAARPAFLAGLERSAAARYRTWAEAVPDQADVLLECARREDEIADLIAAAFPISDDDQAAVDAHLPGAIDVYYEVFAPFTVAEQLYLQSEAELQGALAWTSMAEVIDDPATRDVLARCADLEEASSRDVKGLLSAV